MSYQLINNLCESRVFRTRESLDKYDAEQLAEFFYAYLLATLILSQEEKAHMWALSYASHAAALSNFDYFRISGNDLYMLAHAQNQQHPGDPMFADQLVFLLRGIARQTITGSYIQSYLMRVEKRLKITNSKLKNIRRAAHQWVTSAQGVRVTNLTQLRRIILSHSRMSEVLSEIDGVLKRQGPTLGQAVGVIAAAGLAGLIAGLRYDPRKDRRFLRPVIGESMKEEDHSQLLEMVTELEKSPIIESVVSIAYVDDGVKAVVRSTSGESYEFLLRMAAED